MPDQANKIPGPSDTGDGLGGEPVYAPRGLALWRAAAQGAQRLETQERGGVPVYDAVSRSTGWTAHRDPTTGGTVYVTKGGTPISKGALVAMGLGGLFLLFMLAGKR